MGCNKKNENEKELGQPQEVHWILRDRDFYQDQVMLKQTLDLSFLKGIRQHLILLYRLSSQSKLAARNESH